jgi:hypothetical protein
MNSKSRHGISRQTRGRGIVDAVHHESLTPLKNK